MFLKVLKYWQEKANRTLSSINNAYFSGFLKAIIIFLCIQQRKEKSIPEGKKKNEEEDSTI